MLKVEQYVNELMNSNCFVVWNDSSKKCVVIDPASEKALREISFIDQHGLSVDYILLTNEHTDHTWGVNALLEKYPSALVVCSEICKQALPKEARAYFQFYYDDPDYVYNVARVDKTTDELNGRLDWDGNEIRFIPTPGHSKGSVCIAIGDMLFGGDTLMPFKPFIKKKNGGSKDEFSASLETLQQMFPPTCEVYPGHGAPGTLEEMIAYGQMS